MNDATKKEEFQRMCEILPFSSDSELLSLFEEPFHVADAPTGIEPAQVISLLQLLRIAFCSTDGDGNAGLHQEQVASLSLPFQLD